MSDFPPKLPDLPKKLKSFCPPNFPKIFRKVQIGKAFIDVHVGPTNESNWLIPNLILMSAYPFNRIDEHGMAKLKRIFKDGKINTFVNLMETSELKRFTSYMDGAKKLNKKFNFIHFPVTDMNIPSSLKKTRKLVKDLIKILKSGERILIHCWGGHGRTGHIVGCLMSELYPSLKYSEIMLRIQICHDCRNRKSTSLSPQTMDQFLYVSKYIGNERIDWEKFKVKENEENEDSDDDEDEDMDESDDDPPL